MGDIYLSNKLLFEKRNPITSYETWCKVQREKVARVTMTRIADGELGLGGDMRLRWYVLAAMARGGGGDGGRQVDVAVAMAVSVKVVANDGGDNGVIWWCGGEGRSS